MKSYVICSDVHGSITTLRKVVDFFLINKFDKLIILGDLLYHGPRNDVPKGYNPKEVISLLNPLKDKIIMVRGNCDAEVDQMVLEFPMRGDYHELYLDGHRFFLTHGHLYDEEHLPFISKGDVFMHGHFHKPVLKEKDGVIIYNPSSISLPKESVKSYGVYENHELSIYSIGKELLMCMKL